LHVLQRQLRLDHKSRTGLLFAAPAVAFFGVLYVFPVAFAGFISLQDWNLLNPPRWVGLANYEKLLADTQFANSALVTMQYTVGTVVPIWVISLGLALMMNRSFRGWNGYMTLFLVPAVVSLTVWSIVWSMIYHPSFGLLQAILSPIGLGGIRWLDDPQLAMPALIILSIVKGTPVYMLIFLAGLRGIPPDYYDAASLDGAGSVARFRHITMPLLKPVTLYVMVYSIVIAFQVITPAFILTGGGPGSATRVIPLFVYDQAFKFLRMGYAAAASLEVLAALLLITLVLFRLFGRDPRA